MRTKWIYVFLVVSALMTAALFADGSPGFHYNNQRTGWTPALGPVEPDLLWDFQAGGSIHASPVVGADGTVYLAASDGALHAIDANGQPRWTFQAQDGIYATPALDSAGNVYFGDLAGWYHSVRPDGSLRWSLALTEGTDRRILASPLVLASGMSYVAAWNNYLYAIDSDGNISWRTLVAGMPSSSPVADGEGNVYLATLQGSDLTVIKFSPGSATPSVPVWIFREPLGLDRNRVVSSPAVDGSRKTIYVGASRTSDGVVCAVDLETGTLAFRQILPRGILSSVAVGDDGAPYVGCLDGRLYCLSLFGFGVQWSFKTDGYYVLGSPSIDGVGNIYVGDSDGTIYALARDGRELWRTASQSSIVSSPVAVDGRLYVTSCDNRLYALASPSRTFYFPQIADGFSGNAGLGTQLLLSNSGEDTQVQLQFFDSSAAPWPVSFVPLGTFSFYSAFSIPLKHGETVSLDTKGFNGFWPLDLSIGYARLTAGERVNGTAILTHVQSNSNQVRYQTSVPGTEPTKEFSLFVDRTGGRETGLALVNAGDSDADPLLSLRDASAPVATKTISEITGQALLKGQHLARYAAEMFPELQANGIERGVLEIKSDSPTAAVTLCEFSDPTVAISDRLISMSTLPVIRPPTEGASGPQVFFFPQIGNGGSADLGLRTSLLFTNTGEDADLVVEFFGSDGSPLSLDLVDLGPRSSISTRLTRGQVFSAQTTGEGPVLVGYARVTTVGTVSGAARFSYKQGGVVLFETGVPASRPLNDCSVFQNSAHDLETGIALVNTGSAAATVTLRLYDSSYRLVASKEMRGDEALSPGAHVARYAKELFAGVDVDGVPLGIITVQSDQPLVVLSLGHADGRRPHLDDIPRLVMFPVIEDRPDR